MRGGLTSGQIRRSLPAPPGASVPSVTVLNPVQRPLSAPAVYCSRMVRFGRVSIYSALTMNCLVFLSFLESFPPSHLAMTSSLNEASSSAPQKMTTDELYGTLDVWEAPWRDKQLFLQSRGYMLRPRYRPDWIPSWRTSDENPFYAEDGILAPVCVRQYHVVPMFDNLKATGS